ncbi:MAG: HEAT repeat domain-containing protein [Kiritimatiellia bacterium]
MLYLESLISCKIYKIIGVLTLLIFVNGCISYETKISLANDPKTPAIELSKLSEDSDYRIRKCVAANPGTPRKVLENLAEDEQSRVRSQICYNPNSSAFALSTLALKGGLYVSDGMAYIQHPQMHSKRPLYMLGYAILTSESTESFIKKRIELANKTEKIDRLKILAHDSSNRVKSAVIDNKFTPVSVFEMLSKDSDDYIRAKVAGKKGISQEVLTKLSKDSNENVRKAVASNTGTPESVLVRLSIDKQYTVRCHVGRNPTTPPHLLKRLAEDYNSDVRASVAENEKAPVELIRKLADDKNYKVIKNIAANPNTPVDVLRKCKNRSGLCMNSCLVRNPSTPNDLLEEIAQGYSSDSSTYKSIMNHPNCSSKTYEIAKKNYHKICEQIELKRKRIAEVELKKSLADAQDLSTTIERLNELSSHYNTIAVRVAVAKNPKITLDIIRKLLKEKDEAIFKALCSNPDAVQKITKQIALENAQKQALINKEKNTQNSNNFSSSSYRMKSSSSSSPSYQPYTPPPQKSFNSNMDRMHYNQNMDILRNRY